MPDARFSLLILVISYVSSSRADINSGCPSWGCLSWGSFSLSSGIPPTNGAVKWSTEIAHVDTTQDILSGRGCVSDQETVVCATHSGYVSLDPATGTQLWNYTVMTMPYLPIMDIYGDVIGMDIYNLVYVGSDGKPKQPISIGILHPSFSVMIANDSVLFLTSSRADTAQVFTYDTDGIIDGAVALTGSALVNGTSINGTFVPSSHPIIAGYRAYVVTQFIPDNSSKVGEVNIQRLYAMDLLSQMAPKIKIAWYFNMTRDDQGRGHDAQTAEGPEPVVTYFRNTVYVNNPGYLDHSQTHRQQDQAHLHQPYPGTLWAIRDDGSKGTLVFKKSCMYGPMAVYDTYTKPMVQPMSAEDDRTVWILNRSPPMLAGHSAANGTSLGIINVADVGSNVTLVTSRISVTRQSATSTKDVLVMGVGDSSGQASLLALETDSAASARLMWQAKLSETKKPTRTNDYVSWSVAGQIVNVAMTKPSAKGDIAWQLGVVAMVIENGVDYSKTHVMGVF